jgi:hypothetical protein
VRLGVKVTVLADIGCYYSAIPRSAVEDARKSLFRIKVGVSLGPNMLNMAIRGENEKQKCSATEMLMSAVTIIKSSRTLCLRGVRKACAEEEMDHSLTGRPVLDEMCFVASQHLDSILDKFYLHDFSHIGESSVRWGSSILGPCQSFYSSPPTFTS